MKGILNLISVLILSMVLVNCGHQSSPIIPLPPRAIIVSPSLLEVNKGLDKTIIENVKLGEKLKEQQQIVEKQKVAIVDVMAQAENIKQKANSKVLVTELEAFGLVEQVKGIQNRNDFLVEKNSELISIKIDQEKILQDTKVKSEDTLQKLLAKESEADNLRLSAESLAKNVSVKDDEIKDLQEDLSEEKVKSAKSGVYRNWILGIVGGFILWTIIKNIIMIYSPIKFRI